jgi:hypothetical protein
MRLVWPWIWGQVVEKIKRAVYKLRRVQLKLLGQATSDLALLLAIRRIR